MLKPEDGLTGGEWAGDPSGDAGAAMYRALRAFRPLPNPLLPNTAPPALLRLLLAVPAAVSTGVEAAADAVAATAALVDALRFSS